jgi:hypothetical protein
MQPVIRRRLHVMKTLGCTVREFQNGWPFRNQVAGGGDMFTMGSLSRV